MVITQRGNILPEGFCEITNGPNKYDLQASVFDKDKPALEFSVRTISGTIKMSQKFFVRIAFAGPEEGSKECFIGTMEIGNSKGVCETRAFFYDCRTRKGHLRERGLLWKCIK